MAGAKDVKEIEEVREVKDRNKTGPVKNYTDLLVYKQAYRLTLRVSAFSKTMPREEQFELGRQLRRSSRSVGANIVEGWTKRISPAEFKRHLVIAAGEVAETKYWLELAADEGFVVRHTAESLVGEYSKLGFMIHNLWKEWRKL
ncbi:MAG TPA: four helix bundle protein [Candidatus Acidoferrum sp.]|nr:four helix bundle protein [Candidatus Acidoferrum sp.]